MGPQFDYLGQAGDYHMFRDQATGEEYPVGQEDADYLMAQQAAAPMQSMQPPQPAEENVPLTGVIGIPGQASAPSPGLPKLQGIPQEFGGAPPAAPPKRIPIPGSEQQSQPMRQQLGPGLYDNGDGTISRMRAGTKGGWQDTARRTSGVDPALVSPQLEAENSLYQRERENAMTAEEIRRDQLLAEREAAAAARQEAELKRQQADAKVAQLNADRDSKWQEFSRRQENIKQMKVDPSAGENWATVLLSALAAGAGAYGSAMTGSPNFALDILNRAKEQKINAQQYAISKAKDDLGTEREEYDRYLSVTLDGRKLEQQAAIERQQIEETRQLKADEGLRGLAPQLDDLLAQLERQHNQTLSQIYNQYQVEAAERYVPPTAGGIETIVDPRLKRAAEVGDLKARARKGSEPEAGTGPVMWRGKELGRIDKEVAKELNAKAIATKAVVRVLDKVIELQKKGSSLSPDDRALLQNLNSRAVLTQAKALGLRVGSDNDWNKIEEAIGAGSFDTVTRQGRVQAEEMRREAVTSLSEEFEHYSIPSDDVQQEFGNKTRRTDVEEE